VDTVERVLQQVLLEGRAGIGDDHFEHGARIAAAAVARQVEPYGPGGLPLVIKLMCSLWSTPEQITAAS
jgi:hypothetical protein